MYGIITTVNKARLGAVRWQNRARRSRDAVKEELRMKKRNRLTICLVAGVLILAVSATAAFGSVNGYSKYKGRSRPWPWKQTISPPTEP